MEDISGGSVNGGSEPRVRIETSGFRSEKNRSWGLADSSGVTRRAVPTTQPRDEQRRERGGCVEEGTTKRGRLECWVPWRTVESERARAPGHRAILP
jgi:hypothetical protein